MSSRGATIQCGGRDEGEDGCPRTEAQIGVMDLQAQEHQGSLAEAGRGKKASSPQVSEAVWPCAHLDRGLLASRLLFKLPRVWYFQRKETNTERKVSSLWRKSWKYLAEVLWQQYDVT